MIRVLVVDDSVVARTVLRRILNSDPEITVAGEAADGHQAVELAERLHPDLITMDIEMPRMNGFEATRRILEHLPIPILIVSSSSQLSEAEKSFRAIEAGALAILSKPGPAPTDNLGVQLLRMIKIMAKVKVVTRRYPKIQNTIEEKGHRPHHETVPPERHEKIVAIGASAGGPQALAVLLHRIAGIPAPVLIAQHIARGFCEGLARWLAEKSGMVVRIARHGEQVVPGQVYLAPDGYHLGVSFRRVINLSPAADTDKVCPSIAHLFHSALDAYGQRATGVVLSGMGSDGARELLEMRGKGCLTFAQDEESAIIFGIPGEAVKIGAARYVLPPDKIADELLFLLKS